MKLLLTAILALAGANAAAATPWNTIVAGRQSQAEQLATIDLQRYLAQVTGVVPQCVAPQAWQARPEPAIILGTLAGNPLLAQIAAARQIPGGEGYLLANATLAGRPVVIAVAQSEAGAVNAVYGLLRELGYAFFLGSEAVPESLPARLPTEGPVVRKPVFAVRGVLPWYNFFDSPTTWDPIDHRAVIDQLIRSGANFIGFHSYDSEPFAAYPDDGTMKSGRRLLNTGSPTWGTHPTPTGQFAGGTDKLFADEYFGAATTRSADDPAAVIQREQDVVRDAFDYARRRGVHTCIGFETIGDPTDPAARDTVVKRLNRLLDQYPALDYIWIWQTEAQGVSGYRGKLSEPLALLGALRRDAFRRVVDNAEGERSILRDTSEGRFARAVEGARLEQFARLAYRVLQQRRDPPRLVVSGWGGDQRLLSAEYYEGLDKLLPPDVVFSSLDHIDPRPRVDRIYGELPPGRERWPIPWLEFDGDQWHAQPYVHVYEDLARDAQRGGSQGLLGIHWRTRDVEENLAFLVDYAWQPQLTAEAFFHQLAARCYPAPLCRRMADIHNRLDQLGYRWIGGGGQTECGEFHFAPGTTEKIGQLRDLRGQLAALLPQAGKSAARVGWLLARIDWTLAYAKAEIAAIDARKLLDAGQPADALATLDAGDLSAALRAFAGRLTTRGEYGTLATVNAKAVPAWRELRGQCLAALGRGAEELPAPPWQPQPQILLPRFLASVAAGQDLELTPICLGGHAAWVHYRPLGHGPWRSLALRPVQGWVCRAVVPSADLVAPGIELVFSFDQSPTTPAAWGPCAVTVMPALAVDTAPRPRRPRLAPSTIGLACTATPRWPFLLQWNDVPDADFYKIYRDDRPIAETCAAIYPDAPTQPAPRHAYRVEACRDGRTLAKETVSAASPDSAAAETLQPRVRWTRTHATFQWPLAEAGVACYDIERAGPDAPGRFVPVARLPATRLGPNQWSAALTPGRTIYRIAPVNQAGRKLAAAEVSLEWPNDELRPLTLDDVVSRAIVRGRVERAAQSAHFTGQGYLEMSHSELLNFASGGTVSFAFRAEQLDGMPVLLSHGQWQLDGWFFQILGRRLILRTTDGDLGGPEIHPGRWYSVRWDNDGSKSTLAVDGRPTAPARALRIAPCQRALRVGQYDRPASSYAFQGTIRDVAIGGWAQKSDLVVHFDFAGHSPWRGRDGKTNVVCVRSEGRPTARVEIGGHGDSRFNSVWLWRDPVDLALTPLLSFRVRTSTSEPLALLLQHENDREAWWAVNLVGHEKAYRPLADLNPQRLNDGRWHDVRIDLGQLFAGRLQAGEKPRIENLLLGSWQNPKAPIVVEFQDFTIGPKPQ
jgi:hypothetical protein